MSKRPKYCAIIFAIFLLSSCGLIDSGVEWRGGPYSLMWIDSPDNVSLCRDDGDTGCTGRVDATVFAVGWNGHFVVAKQHPEGDKSKTNYYIIESRKNSRDDVTTGPLTEQEFMKKSAELDLPKFSKVLEALQ